MDQTNVPNAPPNATLDAKPADDFEQRFLEFAYTTTYIINATTVAFALRMSIDEANEKLEDLAARDVLLREVDEHASVYYQLPGRQTQRAASAPAGVTLASSKPASASQALMPFAQQAMASISPAISPASTPEENKALVCLLVNTFFLPGLGSIIGGRTSTGVGQLILLFLGFPLLLFYFLGFPMILAAWIWAFTTGIGMINKAKEKRAVE